jgi:hypothetical protein
VDDAAITISSQRKWDNAWGMDIDQFINMEKMER